MNKFEVLFYDLPDGSEPVADFLDSLDLKMRAKVLKEIGLLEDYGPELREPYSKSIGDDIFELRTKLGTDITRVLYFFFVGRKVILTNGFVKKTDKTPPAKRIKPCVTAKNTSAERSIEMSSYQSYLNKQLENPEFKAEYDALEPEFEIIRALIDARKSAGITQKDLSQRTGIAQSDISKLENGNANPSLRTLQRLAAGLGMQVKIQFLPIQPN